MNAPKLPIDIPRILIAALGGGSGKTLLSIGIAAALSRMGKTVVPFKKGPDYIDAGWLALAAGRPCFNLDTFMCGDAAVCRSFFSRTMAGGAREAGLTVPAETIPIETSPTGGAGADPGVPSGHIGDTDAAISNAAGINGTSAVADIAVIEGNRGLYDGLDADGTTSTASLAKLLSSPVVLCLDCTKTTRTMAAVVLGCLHFDPQVMIKGVILNQIAGARHERIIRQSIENHCGVPVIGAVPKLRSQHFPERHMGLIPTPEHAWATDAVNAMADVIAESVNLSDLMAIAATAKGFCCPEFAREEDVPSGPGILADAFSEPAAISFSDSLIPEGQGAAGAEPDRRRPVTLSRPSRPRIGVIRDAAFQFYYPENLDALQQAGADLVFFSPLETSVLPDIHALYIGGGFPETHAAQLSENEALRAAIRAAAANGLPIYAECGGLMYLGESLVLDRVYPMTGVLPLVFGFSKKPQGHGYTIARVDRDTPYYPAGTVLRGHEFHYSKVLEWTGEKDGVQATAFAMEKGKGILNGRDGICINNVLATYTHIHALGTPSWAPALIRLAK